MPGITTQTATLATIPTATPIAADQVGAATAPSSGDRIQYVKLDQGAAGASSPVTAASPLLVQPQLAAGTLAFRGRVNTFRTPGRAGTAGQKIFAIHNATGSGVTVHITKMWIDLAVTVVKAVTVLPPIIRAHRVTVLPTNGTALTKVALDTGLSSSASVTAFGDASADGTGSGTTLTATIPANNILSQEYAPRLITAVGYEMFDRTEFFEGTIITLRPLQGVVLELVYTLATQNPATDMWIAGCEWEERT